MDKLRSISTGIWCDTWFETLNPNEKLLFIYLLTNDRTNMLGVYEISVNKISFDIGIKKETILKYLESFENIGKVKYKNNYIILINFLKNQSFNTNMRKSAVNIYNSLPNELKTIELAKGSESFESLLNPLKAFGILLKKETEIEIEKETKKETKITVFSFSIFWELYPIKKGKKETEIKYNKLSEIDRQKIKDTINKFVNYKPFDKYSHPNPLTYINQERWNDELGTKQNDIPIIPKRVELSHGAEFGLPNHIKERCYTGEITEGEGLLLKLAEDKKHSSKLNGGAK